MSQAFADRHPVIAVAGRYLLYLACACALWAVVALAAGCVMPGDLREIADAQERLDDRLAVAATVEDVKAARDDFEEEVEAVAEKVEERTKGDLDALKDLGIPGAITAAGLAWLNARRNSTRKTDPAVSNALKT